MGKMNEKAIVAEDEAIATAKAAEEKAAKTLLWRALSVTDPGYTKPFDRGRFKGTMIDPTWRMMRMTELFGPVGLGWGWEELQHVVENGCVFIQMRAWFKHLNDKVFTGPQWGGTELMSRVGKGENAKFVPNDEAFKMSSTDALGKCLLSLGLAADVYLGFFDDSKYREEAGEVYDAKAREANRGKREEKREAGRAHVAGDGGDGRMPDDMPPIDDAANDQGRGDPGPGGADGRIPDAEWVKLQVKIFGAIKKLPQVKQAWATIHGDVTELAERDPDSAQSVVNAYQRAVTRCTPQPARAAG